MAPYYNPFIATPQQDDDIVRVQKLYGPNQKSAMMRKESRGLHYTTDYKPHAQEPHDTVF